MPTQRKVRTCETMEEFSSFCSLKNCDTLECGHPEKIADHCIDDRRYCPRVAETDRRDMADWKSDYSLYLETHDKEYKEKVLSPDSIKIYQLRYPRMHVLKTLEQQRRYWTSKKKGYLVNIKRKSDTLDWVQIYKDALQRAHIKKKYINIVQMNIV